MTGSLDLRAIGLAASLAAAMHLLLFMAVRPAEGTRRAGMPPSPETHYLAKPSGQVPMLGNDVRTVGSPVLFSLPSNMGFSHELLQTDLRTKLTFTQQVESDTFLEVDSAARNDGVPLVSKELMLTTGAAAGPQLPKAVSQPLEKRLPSRRVHIAPELKARLVGGVVLPPELNKETETAWQIEAEVSISGQGVVRHVFLDQPLEPDSLNRQVLQLLYGLRFKPGDGPVEGCIEILSPKTSPAGGAAK